MDNKVAAVQANEPIYQIANHFVGGILWCDVEKEVYDRKPDDKNRRIVFGQPPAHDTGAAARLRRVLRLLGLANAAPADDAEMMSGLFSLFGIIARAIEHKLPQADADSTTSPEALTDDPVALHAEIFRLRAALQGPDGFETWRDAAVDERVRRVEAESKLKELASLASVHPEPVGVIEVDNVFGWHMRALQAWAQIGQGTKLYKLPEAGAGHLSTKG